MSDKTVRFLDTGGAAARYDDRHIAQLTQLAAIAAQKPDRTHATRARGFRGPGDVAGVAGSRNTNQAITFPTEPHDLAIEDIIEAVVIGDARQSRGIVRQ